jgi:hypothetical protein
VLKSRVIAFLRNDFDLLDVNWQHAQFSSSFHIPREQRDAAGLLRRFFGRRSDASSACDKHAAETGKVSDSEREHARAPAKTKRTARIVAIF